MSFPVLEGHLLIRQGTQATPLPVPWVEIEFEPQDEVGIVAVGQEKASGPVILAAADDDAVLHPPRTPGRRAPPASPSGPGR